MGREHIAAMHCTAIAVTDCYTKLNLVAIHIRKSMCKNMYPFRSFYFHLKNDFIVGNDCTFDKIHIGGPLDDLLCVACAHSKVWIFRIETSQCLGFVKGVPARKHCSIFFEISIKFLIFWYTGVEIG